jgi:hypothetical protein
MNLIQQNSRQTKIRLSFFGFIFAGLMIWLAGCVSEKQAEDKAEEKTPRVFFIEPENGATVSTPVLLKFGVENFTIAPVVEPPVIQEGVGHFHIAIDGECVKPGEIIPKADPYIHFGDGTSEIEVLLLPGTHRICLQIGDGEHRVPTGPGMTTEMTITVE